MIKPFDWTFTTDYRGTLTGKNKMTMKVKTFSTLSLINTKFVVLMYKPRARETAFCIYVFV